jgi:hypothetical protein
MLKDEFDEWLARIICYCFSLSPQALIKQMNRATAETAKQTAQEEGLEPLKLWFKDTVDACWRRPSTRPSSSSPTRTRRSRPGGEGERDRRAGGQEAGDHPGRGARGSATTR